MLAEPVEPLMRTVNAERNLRVECLFAVHLCRVEHAVGIGRQLLPVRALVVDRPALSLDRDLQLCGREHNRLIVLRDVEACGRPILLHHHMVRCARRRLHLQRRVGHVQHVGRIHLEFQYAILLMNLNPVGLFFKAHHRVRRIPLCYSCNRRPNHGANS